MGARPGELRDDGNGCDRVSAKRKASSAALSRLHEQGNEITFCWRRRYLPFLEWHEPVGGSAASILGCLDLINEPSGPVLSEPLSLGNDPPLFENKALDPDPHLLFPKAVSVSFACSG